MNVLLLSTGPSSDGTSEILTVMSLSLAKGFVALNITHVPVEGVMMAIMMMVTVMMVMLRIVMITSW